jgi:hypothetical protein
MNRTELFHAGRKAISDVLADSSAKDVAKGLLSNGPAKAAGAAVLTRVLGFGFMPLAASFAVGAVVGAGALILLAPGGDAMRAAVGEEIEKWNARRRAANAGRTSDDTNGADGKTSKAKHASVRGTA